MHKASLLILALAGAAAAADNWPQFRGPGSRGIGEGATLPDTWSATENVVWKAEIPGRGWSSPVVWGDKVFLTTVVNEGQDEPAKKGLYLGGDRKTPPGTTHRWLVYCLDFKTGNVVWERKVHEGVPPASRHIKNSYASETPCTDGERLYAYFGNVGLFCLDLDGKELWSRKWGSFPTQNGWGTAASPVVHKGRVYVVNDNQEKSFLTALDARTGEPVWKVDRDEKSNWATPFVWENDYRTEIVTPGTGKTRSYGLDGKLLWELKGASTITIPTPFTAHGLLYVGSGFILSPQRPLYAIRPGASGDISLAGDETSNGYVAWCQKTAAPYNPSFLVYGDYLYVLLDRGQLSCYDARTGKPVYDRQRLGGSAGFTVSPWAYNGKVLCLSEDGETFVVEAGPEFRVVGKNRLDELCMATPAIAHGSLLIRTETKLYRLQKDAK
jgi:outer membrane protein assembly factor BamB